MLNRTALCRRGRQFAIPSRCLSLLLILLVAGCATLPSDYPRTHSSAIEDYRQTPIGSHYAPHEDAHPGESGLGILRYGRNAFTVRLGMIDRAVKSIDLQVYIWQADETGRILAERLLRAADRGVRVRLLVDDMGFAASDENIASLDAHPNIEIRIFNPFANRKTSMFDFLADFDRVNHRMHNKILIADNSMAVVGGRNIGDHYFAVDPATNFRDLDIGAVGPVVRDISEVFDYFWAADTAVPIRALVDREYTQGDLQRLATMLRTMIAQGSYPYVVDDDLWVLESQLGDVADHLVWAPATIVWNNPNTAATGAPGEIIQGMRRKLDTVQRSLIIESAYFVVGDQGVERVRTLVNNGVHVRVLTNSLASNDVLAAHAGHAKYRQALLEAGAEVYELRPDSAVVKKTWVGKSTSGLHTKALVFDDESLFIGSFNLDPRSANINTEAGLYVRSPELAALVLEYMNEGITPENSYRLSLDEHGDLEWITRDDGRELRFDKDPMSTFGQRFSSGFLGILPIESQL